MRGHVRVPVRPAWAVMFSLQVLATIAKDRTTSCERPAFVDFRGDVVGERTTAISLNCSDEKNLVAFQIKHQGRKSIGRVSVWACPKVKQLNLNVSSEDGQAQWMDGPSLAGVVQCSRSNDTMTVEKGHVRAHFSPRFKLTSPASQQYRLDYSYTVHEKTARRQLSVNTSDTNNGTLDAQVTVSNRSRRSVSEMSSQGYSSNKTVTKDASAAMTYVHSAAGCGSTRTCIRFGREGCGHMQCEYMLSYQILNKTEVDIELSALSKGWVAVGFSSDKYMGGGDDVIGCKRHQLLSTQVVSMSLSNSVPHSRPREKENRLTLLDGMLRNGYIYCHLKRPLRSQMRTEDSDLDLTNDWHQLYAVGEVNGNGAILQHSKLPWVSPEKITMLRHMDVQSTTSKASRYVVVTSFPLFLLLLLSLVVS
ncbi:uncharacterized protein LOC112565046 [Pomacea canaliculata]|uniref:uncharacterized protein LOC112565046 n=1 Tax=Pomacea canaliculata TaxID=400727 RepID=UPI000D727F92|nr:uncharacterized protein LOC112565046 [Pomacea canaliculata]